MTREVREIWDEKRNKSNKIKHEQINEKWKKINKQVTKR